MSAGAFIRAMHVRRVHTTSWRFLDRFNPERASEAEVALACLRSVLETRSYLNVSVQAAMNVLVATIGESESGGTRRGDALAILRRAERVRRHLDKAEAHGDLAMAETIREMLALSIAHADRELLVRYGGDVVGARKRRNDLSSNTDKSVKKRQGVMARRREKERRLFRKLYGKDAKRGDFKVDGLIAEFMEKFRVSEPTARRDVNFLLDEPKPPLRATLKTGQ